MVKKVTFKTIMNDGKYPLSERLQELYWEQELMSSEISKIVAEELTAIYPGSHIAKFSSSWMRNLGLPVRTASENNKLQHKNPEMKKKLVEAIRESRTDEFKEKMSKIKQEHWEKEEYRETRAEGLRRFREENSERYEEWIKGNSETNKKRWAEKSEEELKAWSEKCKSRWTPEERKAQSERIKAYFKTPEGLKRREEISVWHNMVYRKKHIKYRDTGIEVKTENFLEYLNIPYKKQAPIKFETRMYNADFLLLDNLIIECNGDFWHGNPFKYSEENFYRKQKSNRRDDIYKFNSLKALGYKILFLWEQDLDENPEKCIELIELFVSNKGELPYYHSYQYDDNLNFINETIGVGY